ncbi:MULTISPECIES: histidine-type phosphatase [Acidobacteriaceae]|uniref:histidine-type phosphatase n=1 Tax=Acidobacteriaceae TaxID=204434 RepID=UPI00131B8636|nr:MULTISPECIES: histidine-type phosphatase [Acidobacteriaceae]MDW5266157.1 histidine-type phosphatase [Edaphobacter sp.]
MTRCLLSITLVAFLCAPLVAQTVPSPSQNKDAANLAFVVYLSRHGVRSPTGKASQYSIYSAAPWPAWDVKPGYLTAHGYTLMKLFGAYDRAQLASEGLLSAQGCEAASSVTIYADSDQRTRETGNALSEGLFPGCNARVQSLPEGTNDALFHPVPAKLGPLNSALAAAAIAGRVGGDPNNLTTANDQQLAAFDNILATCGASPSAPSSKRTSILTLPASITTAKGDHLAELRGPINTAATLTENILLEYTQGMDAADVGWGCVDGIKLRSLIGLHTVASDFAQRTPVIAQAQASNLLDHIERSLEQAATCRAVPGAVSRPADRALFLVGHDTNLSNIAGLLNLTWIADDRRDDTPPGSALVFELWKDPTSGRYSVRVYFTAQTLEQMRAAATLSPANPPSRVPVFLPGCSRQDLSCSWTDFSQTVHQAIDPSYVQK